MPFYEYQCKNCGRELEAMQKVSDSPLKKCPHCGKSQLQRLMSAPVFRLKGSGWYETDFKDDKDKKRNLAEQPEAPDASKNSDAKAEVKPDAKADDKAGEKSEKASSDPVMKAKDPSVDKLNKKSPTTEKPVGKKNNFSRQRRGAAKPVAKARQKRR